MTISTTTKKNTYSGDGSTTSFAFSFPIQAQTELLVEIKDSAGTITTQTLTTDYTVNGTGNRTGFTDYTSGNVVFVTAPVSTDTIVIRRNVPLTQATDYTENGKFPAETHERALDKLTLIDLQQQEEIDRTLRLTSADSVAVSTELPSPVGDRALIWNAAGTAIVNSATSFGGSVSVTETKAVPTTTLILSNDYSAESAVYTQGYTSIGDGGHARWYATGNTVLGSAGTTDLDNGIVYDSVGTEFKFVGTEINLKQFGAVGDGTTSDDTVINSVITYSSAGFKIIVPDGTFVINDSISPAQGTTWEFHGWIKLDDNGSLVTNMFNLANDDCLIINPQLDMDSANNTDFGSNGVYTALKNGANNCTVIGGTLKNSFHNLYQGAANNFKMIGTRLYNCGEHGIYINKSPGDSDGMYFINITIDTIGTDTTQDESHYAQVQNVNNISFVGCRFLNAFGTKPNFAFSISDVDNFVCSGLIAEDINHNMFFADSTCNNIKFVDSTFTKIASPLVPSVCDSNGDDVTVNNCVFDGFAQTDDCLNMVFKDCTFNNIYTPMQGNQYCLYSGCTFREKSGVTLNQFWQNSPEPQDFENCIFYGNPTSGLEFTTTPVTKDNWHVKYVEFVDHSTQNSIYINKGQNHTIVGVKNLVYTGASTIRTDAVDLGNILIGECLVEGGINDNNTGTTTTYGNRTI